MMIVARVSAFPPLVIGAVLVCALLVPVLAHRLRGAREWLALGASGGAFLALLYMLPSSLGGTVYTSHLIRMTPPIVLHGRTVHSLWMAFRVDQLGLFFGLAVATLWLLAAVYSLGYMKGEHALTRYYGFMLLCLAWTLGVAFAGNLLTLFIFYELFSISTYPLIAHEETPEAIAAAKKYIIYILIGGTFVLFGIVLTFYLAGSQTLRQTGILPWTDPTTLRTLFWIFVLGFGVKAAIMPLHGWVPDAHPAAPAPISALLSGVMVAAGTFGLTRVVLNVFGAQLIRHLGVATPFALVVSFTIIVASLMALDQDDLKRRLAYSTIGQMGYIMLGLILLTPQSALGGLLHLANHAFMKGALFFCAGVIIKKTGKRRVSEMAGIARRLPITMVCFSIAALAMIGTPPLSGFISKWFLGVGALQAGQPLYIVVLLLSSLLGAAYFLPVVYTAFFREPEGEATGAADAGAAHRPATVHDGGEPVAEAHAALGSEAPWTMLAPILVATAYTLLLGLGAATNGLPLSLIRVALGALLK